MQEHFKLPDFKLPELTYLVVARLDEARGEFLLEFSSIFSAKIQDKVCVRY